MADFSVGGAAGAGFRVIARQPLATLVWGLFIWVCAVGPAVFLLSQILAALGPLITQASAAETAQAAAGGAKPSGGPPPEFMQAYMAMMSRLFLFQPLLLIGNLAVRSVLTAAVCRAVLEPEDSAFAYLRLGMRELWVLLVSIVFGLIIGFTAVGLMIPVAIFMGVAAAAHSPILVGLVAVVVVAVAAGVMIWLSLRLYLGVPMSFDQNEFRLFEAWNFSRGHVGKMVVLGLIQIAIALALELVILLILGLVVFGAVSSSGLSTPEQFRNFLLHMPTQWSATAIAIVVVASLAISLVSGFAVAIFVAPWVEVYRQLRDSGARSTPHYQPSLGEARPVT